MRYARDEAALIVAERGSSRVNAGALWTGDRTARRRAAKSLGRRLPLFLRPLARFVYVYAWRRGFLDGRPGFVYAFMLSTYEAMTAIQAYEIAVSPSDERDVRPACDAEDFAQQAPPTAAAE